MASATIQALYTFDGYDGQNPYGSLNFYNGNFYGTTSQGGDSGTGTVFELSTAGDLIATASFTDAGTPYSSLTYYDGNFYGTTSSGGQASQGAVYEYNPTHNTLTTPASFGETANSGLYPYGSLTYYNGNFYGTTVAGGADGSGTLFEFDPNNGKVTPLYNFTGGADGSSPFAETLAVDKDGNLYGTTVGGGKDGDGTVFEYSTTTRHFTTLAYFDGANGANPDGGLTIGADGNLYGTASEGGAKGDGTVFELNTTNDHLSALASFNGTNGANPLGGVIADADGNLYGTASSGGNGYGTVFVYDKADHSLTALASFDGTNGSNPQYETLYVDAKGNLYGTTDSGGANGSTYGTVFEVTDTGFVTTYSWDAGSGTWNASSAADWNPPNNGTVPSSNSYVTIGTGAGGTVSLGLDQTVNSLAITNKYTLNGNGHSITTSANASVAAGGALSINNLNVGGTFTVNGRATINGVLTSVGTITTNAGGKLALSNGTINDSIIAGKGTFQTTLGTNGTLRNVTISSGTIYSAIDKATTHLSGTAITNNGMIRLNGGGGTNGFLVTNNSLTLKGTGALVMSTATGGGDAILQGNGDTLTNASTIEGTGLIGNGGLAIINEGTIDANGKAGVGRLTLNGSGGLTNTGTLEATVGGLLDVTPARTSLNDGTLLAGSGSLLDFARALDNSGTLKSNGGDLTVQGAVTGRGVDQIAAGGTMAFGSSVSSGQTVHFSNIGNTLMLEHAESFSGTVAGLAAASPTSFDAIDLADFKFADTRITGVTGTGAKGTTTNVTLTDKSDGLTTTLHLLNQYASQFAVSKNDYSLTSDNASKPGTIFSVDHTLGVPNHGIGHG